MSIDEKYEQSYGLLNYGENMLSKAASPQLTFKADMVNLFAIPEFQNFTGNFDVGNYIWVSLRDDYSVKARLLSIHISFYDLTDFIVEFGNITRKAKNVYTDITDAVKTAQSAAASVSFNSSNWNKANKTSAAIDQMIADGLLSAGVSLKSGEDSEMIIDRRGIYINTTTGNYIGDSIYMGNGRILFTQDNWLTVEEAIGRVDINGESVFGVIAKAVLAGYIIGSTVTGGNIYGTTITVGGQNNESGTINVMDATGEKKLVLLDKNGITLDKSVSISWDNITGTDNVAYTGDIPTDEYITTITGNAITCETIKGETIEGKRFLGDNIGMNSYQSQGWAFYVGERLDNPDGSVPVSPYNDQHIFNIGHGGEMYAQTGTFFNLRLEDRYASENAYLNFVYTRGTSNPIYTGTIYHDEYGLWIKSDKSNINLEAYEGNSIRLTAPDINLNGTVNSEYTINFNTTSDKQSSADFYYDSSHFGALFANENGMSVESRNEMDLRLKSASGTIKYEGTLEQNSSRRYKENISDISDEYADKILELSAKEYDYISTGKHSLGLIAEDVIKVLPQIVGCDSKGRPDSVSYMEIIPLLIQKIQNLERRIKRLENPESIQED